MAMELRLEGGKELQAALEQLPESVAGRVMTNALKDAAKIPQAAMAAGAPHGKGRLAVDIKISSRVEKEWEARVVVGPSRATNFYGRFIEWGTSKLAARPWARPAWDSTVQPTLAGFQSGLRKRIETAARRLARSR